MWAQTFPFCVRACRSWIRWREGSEAAWAGPEDPSSPPVWNILVLPGGLAPRPHWGFAGRTAQRLLHVHQSEGRPQGLSKDGPANAREGTRGFPAPTVGISNVRATLSSPAWAFLRLEPSEWNLWPAGRPRARHDLPLGDWPEHQHAPRSSHTGGHCLWLSGATKQVWGLGQTWAGPSLHRLLPVLWGYAGGT